MTDWRDWTRADLDEAIAARRAMAREYVRANEAFQRLLQSESSRAWHEGWLGGADG